MFDLHLVVTCIFALCGLLSLFHYQMSRDRADLLAPVAFVMLACVYFVDGGAVFYLPIALVWLAMVIIGFIRSLKKQR